MVKMCVHRSGLVCWHSACSVLDSMGNVVVCPLVRDGFFMPKKPVIVPISVFSKQYRRMGGSS